MTHLHKLIPAAAIAAMVGVVFLLPLHGDRLHGAVEALEQIQKGARGDGDVGPSLIPVCESGRWGYADMRGQVVLPFRFRYAGAFVNGRAVARDTGLFGYIDTLGRWVLEPRWDVALPFSEGLATVYTEGRTEVIDTNGATVFIGSYTSMSPFRGGMSQVEADSGRGLVSRQGTVLVRPGHEYHVVGTGRVLRCASRSSYGVSEVPSEWELIDHNGNVINRFYNVRHVDASDGVPLAVVVFGTKNSVSHALVIDSAGSKWDVLTAEEAGIFHYEAVKNEFPGVIGKQRRETLEVLERLLFGIASPNRNVAMLAPYYAYVPGHEVVVRNDTSIVVASGMYDGPTFLRFFRTLPHQTSFVDSMWVDSVVSKAGSMLVVTVHDTMCLIAPNGAVLWRARSAMSAREPRDITFRGSFFGSYASDEERHHPISRLNANLRGRLTNATLVEGVRGIHLLRESGDGAGMMHLYIVNMRSDTVHIECSYKGVLLHCEARRSPQHEWVPVETRDYRCYFDFYKVPVPPQHFLRITGPAYGGARSYEMRYAFALGQNTSRTDSSGRVIESTRWKMCHSRVFLSRLNPAQFY